MLVFSPFMAFCTGSTCRVGLGRSSVPASARSIWLSGPWTSSSGFGFRVLHSIALLNFASPLHSRHWLQAGTLPASIPVVRHYLPLTVPQPRRGTYMVRCRYGRLLYLHRIYTQPIAIVRAAYTGLVTFDLRTTCSFSVWPPPRRRRSTPLSASTLLRVRHPAPAHGLIRRPTNNLLHLHNHQNGDQPLWINSLN